MPKVKLIKVYGYNQYNDYYDDQPVNTYSEELSDWEEISQKELDIIQDYRWRDKFAKSNTPNSYYQLIVLQEATDEVKPKIESIKKMIVDFNKKQKLEEEKALESKKKAAETKKRKALEKAKKMLKEAGEL